jgi:hypothetical protein
MTHMHKLFHARRPIPDGTPLTKKVAQQRRTHLAAFVLSVIPPEMLRDCMTAPRPPSIDELIELAQQFAAEIRCPHCGWTPTKGD